MYYTAKELIARFKQLPDFKNVPDDYWIIGIRNPNDAPNKFDDVFYLMHGEKMILETTGTTNPGTPVLKGGFLKYNKDGAAVVQADRIYYGVWQFGYHSGKIPALKQLGAAITIFRDGDGDDKSEEIGKKTTGYYGINCHPDQYDIEAFDKNSDSIGWWSAGCQVWNVIKDYFKMIKLVKKQKSVTYCLMNEFSI